jgi:hypothetical protein
MDLVTSGFYWVVQYEKSQKPTIARLTKNSGWEYLASEHSSKMIRNGPYKILKRIEDFGEK